MAENKLGRKLWLPCPHCGEPTTHEEKVYKFNPSSLLEEGTYYECEICGNKQPKEIKVPSRVEIG